MIDIASKAKPLMRVRIEALLRKTQANGCTPEEATSALKKAKELADRYGFESGEFIWPTLTPLPSEPTRRAKGVGKLARELLLQHRDWSHTRIAEEINARLGSATSAASVAWYASKMRKQGFDVGRLIKSATSIIDEVVG